MKQFKSFTYTSAIRNTDYIVRDHRVHGTRLMPGVTHLDMILRLLIQEGYEPGGIELRNIIFKEALATTETYDKRIRISLQPEGDHGLITVASRKFKDDRYLEEQWDENCQCEAWFVDTPLTGQIDPERMKREAHQVNDLADAYAVARKLYIEHKVFMQGLGTTYKGEDYFLAHIHLSDLAQSYLNHFYQHPAYLDAATISILLAGPPLDGIDFDKAKPFIPFFIKSFRARAPLGETCLVTVKMTSVGEDISHNDLTFYDGSGQIVSVFHKLTGKRIRSGELITRLQNVKAQPAPATPVQQTPSPAPAGGNGQKPWKPLSVS